MYIINLHSISDLITNSSTDIFACNSKKSVEQVKSILSTFCKKIGLNINDVLTVESKTVKEVQKIINELCSHYSCTSILLDQNLKIIFISGVASNSIPYWLQVFIEEELNGTRYHLG